MPAQTEKISAEKREQIKTVLQPDSYFSSSFPQETEINILNIWNIFKNRKGIILSVTLFCSIIGVSLGFLLPKKYSAEVSLMPISSKGGMGISSMFSKMESIPMLGDQLGDISGGLEDGKTKEIINILKSRTLTQELIQQFDLMKVLFEDQYNSKTGTFYKKWLIWPVPVLEDGIKKFQNKTATIEKEKKTGLIKIKITLNDPELAAKIANTMVVELQEFVNNNSLTVEKRNRLFIERQLEENKVKLLEAGKTLSKFYSKNQISSTVPELNVKLGLFEDMPNPVENFRMALGLSKTKNKAPVPQEKKMRQVKNVPGQVYLEYLAFDKRLLDRTHALLTQQYEMAKINETNEDLAFQVIDRAEIKVRPDSPKPFILLSVGAFGGLLLGIFIVFFLEHWQALKQRY